MAVGSGIYITWITGAILISVAMMPIFKPPYAKVRIEGFIDMFRRYWAHMIVVFSVYLWKDILDGLDRILMANTQLDMTPYVYAIEGDIVLWVQEGFRNDFLDVALTHFYVMGFMTATFASFVYPIYFDDRHMADRVSLSMFWVYILAIPFYLFFNVRVTGDYIPLMETVAYDLTPEIHNWFTRIDPFTNGMPSLHIGLPFAIWLTMTRWDEDGRWLNFRRFLVAFLALTAFSIVYLGIHWAIDILGGMIVAIAAVSVTERTHKGIWKIADERLFTRKLARLIDNPKNFFTGARNYARQKLSLLKEPGSKQTSVFIAALLLSTGFVLLWDATHQDFPVEGVEWPTSAAGSDDWLIGIEVDPQMDGIDDVEITALNTSLEGRQGQLISGPTWLEEPSISISGSYLLVNNQTRVDLYDLESLDNPYLPIFSKNVDFEIDISDIGYDGNGNPLIVMLTVDGILTMNSEQEISELGGISNEVDTLEVSGNSVAWSIYNDSSGPTVYISSLTEASPTTAIYLDVIADIAQDEFLSEQSGVEINYSKSNIVDIAIDGQAVAVVVDVGPINRTVFADAFSGMQTMISTPIWESSSPSIGNGNVAFLQIPRFQPGASNPEESETTQVFIYQIESNQTEQLTFDEDESHSSPQALLGGVGWIETGNNGEAELKWYNLEETFEPYSSVILQTSVVLLIPLVFTWARQKQSEK
ncbi:MAG TPA: inositol phosphorylceramide synthase [Candidatus Thalassarchaeaceae archaeon]|nr:MAG TPA: inositol phosphorylceramide synthase [Candidatus Poseidoniales archaeon]HII35220.1 inositol phosphorylceramide synthase [Candidatus Thalassarchaeaceae archaeon]|tara:strand:- start:5319 stop:7424 length:2106 start_codon:yes stop_codon:yes gene_type:complete